MKNFNENKNEVTMKQFHHEQFGNIFGTFVNNQPYFWGRSVATALGYRNTSDAISVHVDKEDKLESRFTTFGQRRKAILINESGLFSLILSSKLPTAKEFKHWITSEVIPSIMHNGYYINPKANTPISQNNLFDTLNIEDFVNYKYPHASNISRSNFFASLMVLEESNNHNLISSSTPTKPTLELKTPKNNNVNTKLLSQSQNTEDRIFDIVKPNSTGYYPISSVAKLYHKSGQWLNNLLYENNIQFKNDYGAWELRSKHKEKGYTYTTTFCIHDNKTDIIKYNMYWTKKGVKAIVEYLKNKGYSIEI